MDRDVGPLKVRGCGITECASEAGVGGTAVRVVDEAPELLALVLLCILFFFIGMGYGERQLKKAEATAYQQGYKDALYKRPVSEELDMVCAGLWIGKEDLKYQQREVQK